MHLEEHEAVHAITAAEAVCCSCLVLLETGREIGRNSNVDRPVPLARKDVDARLSLHD